jgi:ABC-type multidrug transport system fused ATPase/permease subunit
MAASSRIAPGALRLQQGFLMLKNSAGGAHSTFELINELQDVEAITESTVDNTFSYEDFTPEIFLQNVGFQYESREHFRLENINLSVPSGSSLAIVGPSGSGKSTLVDLILGVLEPSEGSILIGGKNPIEACRIWPGAISYLPQKIIIIAGTLRENIAMGYERDLATDERIWETIKAAQLTEETTDIFKNFEYQLGENGAKVSGGQAQRIGIARALFTKPKLLVLDEATSALDGKTELNISHAIEKLSGDATVIIVAHRLSTVKNVDKVVYMEAGRIVSVGTFQEVRSRVPAFEEQASLMGL